MSRINYAKEGVLKTPRTSLPCELYNIFTMVIIYLLNYKVKKDKVCWSIGVLE